MANPSTNGNYVFACVASLKGANRRGLNVYGSSITGSSNVCLWSQNKNDVNQQWKVVSASSGYKLQAGGGSTSYYLARNSSSNNAQTSTSAATINFESIDNVANKVKIYTLVSGTKYYLTASASDGNGSSNANTTATGNVYWTSTNYGTRQHWTYHEAPASSTSTAVTIPYFGTYISQQDYNINSQYLGGLTMDEWQDTSCGVIATMYAMRMMDRDTDYMPEDVYTHGYVKYNSGVEMNFDNGTTAYGFKTDIKEGNWNAVKTIIFDEIIAGRPVIIRAKNRAGHFVTAYKLAAGTTRSGITQEDVYVLDPWTPNNDTLKKVTSYSNGIWSTIINVRSFV